MARFSAMSARAIDCVRGLGVVLSWLVTHTMAQPLCAQPPCCQPWCNPWTCNQQDACGSCAICQPSPPPAPLSGVNPFVGVDFLVSPQYTACVRHSVRTAGGSATPLGASLERAAGIPTAMWIDAIDSQGGASKAITIDECAATGARKFRDMAC